MWSLLVFRPFLPSAQIPQAQALQVFPAFRSVPPRIQARHSQTTRATNCATPGYEVEVFLRLWSVMWSLLVFRPFLPSAQIPQAQALQVFPAFRSVPPRIQARHSQTTRADNCATPGYALFKCRLRYYTTSSTSVQEQNSMDRRFAAPCYFFFNSAQSRTMTEIPFGMTVRLCLPILCASSSAASSDGA